MARTKLKLRWLASMCALLCVATPALAAKPTPPPPPPPPVNYDVRWLIPAGPNDSFAIYGVNRQGTTAVGTRYAGGISSAVSIDAATGTLTDLNSVMPGIPVGWQLTSVRGITDSGRIAGEALDNAGSRVLYVYDPADATPFQPVGVGLGNSIRYRNMNDAGDVLFAQFGSSKSWLYKHDDQSTVQLPSSLMLAGELGTAGPNDINNDRVIAGNRVGAASTDAFVYDGDTSTATNIPKYFRAQAINNTGTIVGGGTLTAKAKGNPPKLTAMKYANGVKTALVSNIESEAFDVNDAEQVVGRISGTSLSNVTAFLYDPTQGFWSLNDLIDDTAQDEAYWNSATVWDLDLNVTAASEPTGSGYPVIVGDRSVDGSAFPDGIDRHWGYILTPISSATSSSLITGSVPEPATTVLLAVALALLSARRKRWTP